MYSIYRMVEKSVMKHQFTL